MPNFRDIHVILNEHFEDDDIGDIVEGVCDLVYEVRAKFLYFI